MDIMTAPKQHALAVQAGGNAVRHNIFDFGMFFLMVQAFLFGPSERRPGRRDAGKCSSRQAAVLRMSSRS